MRLDKGKIKLQKNDLETFREWGWDIDVHASNDNGAYYFNHIGITFLGITIGFSCWKDNLGLWIDGNVPVDIKTEQELRLAIKDMQTLNEQLKSPIKNISIRELISDGYY